MSRQFWAESLAWATSSGTQISNTTTETIIHPNITIPANYMQDGRAIEIFHFGMFSNVVTTPGTLIFRIRWGGVAGTILAQSAAIALSTTAQTNVGYELEALLQTRSNGSSGTIFATGSVGLGAEATSGFHFMGSAGNSAPAAVTVDLTADTALSLTAQFSVATSPTNLTGLNYVIKSLN
jgi:hypothetical protein